MNAWSRLKTLWKLSELQTVSNGDLQPQTGQVTFHNPFIKKSNLATIIDMTDPIEEFPQKEA